ncbi:MAG: DUF1963 domain-containing protein [Planctomycetota bacterium]|jgi:hypothetical protein
MGTRTWRPLFCIKRPEGPVYPSPGSAACHDEAQRAKAEAPPWEQESTPIPSSPGRDERKVIISCFSTILSLYFVDELEKESPKGGFMEKDNSVLYYDEKTNTYKPPSLLQSFRTFLKRRRFQKRIIKERAEIEPRRDEILTRFYSEVDKHLRQPSIAQIGGFRPSDEPATSWFGNVLLAAPGQTWPEHKGKPLCPLIQINLNEVPLKPSRLNNFELITVFMDKDIPFDTPNGQRWLVRAYESLDGLVSLEKPAGEFPIKAFPIRWEKGESEGPGFEDLSEIIDSEIVKDFNVLEGDDDLYYSRYQNTERTKLGGWPSLVQHELKMEIDDFMFQVGSEEKGHWNWIDSGTGYFGLDSSGHWKFECQFF